MNANGRNDVTQVVSAAWPVVSDSPAVVSSYHIGEAAVGAASTLSVMSTMQGTSFQFGILTLEVTSGFCNVVIFVISVKLFK